MVRWLLRLLLNGVSLLFISYVFDAVEVKDYTVAVLAAFILGIVNTLVRPILVFLTLPFRLITLGLFWFVINAVTFALTAFLIDGFEIGQWPSSLMTTILAAAMMSVLAWMVDFIVGKKEE